MRGRKRTGASDGGFVTPKPITKCMDESHTSRGGCELISTFERKREEGKKEAGGDGWRKSAFVEDV